MLVLTSRVLLLVRACIWWRSWARRSCLALRDCSSERPGRAARALESTTCLLPFVGVSASTITITIMMTMMITINDDDDDNTNSNDDNNNSNN